jgi:drug/metabolite transporter (DMT)-like permease
MDFRYTGREECHGLSIIFFSLIPLIVSLFPFQSANYFYIFLFVNSDSINKKAYTAVAIVSFFWGTTYLVSRVAVQHIPGLFLAGVRNLIAGAVLVLFFFIRGQKFPDSKTLKQSALLGLVMIAVSSGLSHWSVQYISGGLAAIIGATIPLWMALFSFAVKRGSKFSLQTFIGLMLGFSGILVIFYDHLNELLNTDFRFGIILAVISCITWAAASVYTSGIKINTKLLFGAGLQMLFAGIFLTIITFFTGENVDLYELPQQTWIAMLYLIVIGSILTYSCYVYAVTNLAPARVGVYAYINPVVAIVLGWLLLDEKLNYIIASGTLITVFGVYLVNSSFRKSEIDKSQLLK